VKRTVEKFHQKAVGECMAEHSTLTQPGAQMDGHDMRCELPSLAQQYLQQQHQLRLCFIDLQRRG
jgi:hypothetical protein